MAAQLAAVSEVMQVLGRSRDEDGPVFKTILTNAVALCNAQMAGLILATAQDAVQSLAAQIGMLPKAVALFETGGMKMDPDLSYAARSIVEARLIAFEDMGESDLYTAGSPVVRSMVDDSGIRSVLFVPLVGQHGAIGAITLFRDRRAPFSADEIALVQAFALQAVIAIENVRQFREIETRLERERGMGKILSLISQSRQDERPVFDMIVKNAANLCNAHAAALAMGQVGDLHQTMAASYGLDPATLDVYQDGRVSMGPDLSVGARAILTGKPIHIPDMADTDEYKRGVPVFVSVVEDTGIRTNLLVPLLTSKGAIGVLILFHKEVRPYTQDEIALVETFAAQAVIAIENVRQFREVQERLEREAATSEILSVVS
ncbi:GAF domain-containing protein [uncultured Tateyamaria sp.]|uniref:GAF domain-containing protein n=1 Tax=uncultured Tateyamaria sp. TaxID=455651 RepID=UPI00262C41F2|nr:GAF domain-containing protein [uncultured Tateyamaria sp.]